jgi:hypothetical protein
MNSRLTSNIVLTSLLAAGLLAIAAPVHATNYAGNGNTGFGGPVGNGVLTVTDDHTNITVNLQRGISGSLNDVLVIYIDTGATGYADTSSLTDTGGTEQKGISGYDGSNRSVLTFTNGFRPKYAVAIKPDWMDLWSLANPGSFSYLSGTGQSGSGSANFTLTFPASQIGLAANVSTNIRIFGTLLNPNGAYRSTEAIAGNDVASSYGQGPHPFTNTAFATYIFSAPVAPTNPVTFSVDMTAQVASSAFNPGNGDKVYVGGSFEPTPFAFGLQLTNNPTAANTNIYSGTYPDQNLTNTLETYKFKFHNVAGNADTYDADPNRNFTLRGGGQVLPRIYFNNIPATPSATTNYITFQIDMGPQIYLGHFNPGAGDLIELSGGFQSPQFAAGIILTNNPAAPNTNIYTAVFADHNYPGTQYLPPQNGYKFVIVTSASTNYESGANRSLTTVTNSGTLPLAYFNGVSTYAAIPITFSVDMTVPIASGLFNPGNGDTVGCAGTFMTNQWTVGNVNSFLLTNNPTGANTNLYSGTYIDRNAPGSVEYYKFVVNTNGGGTAYETPTSTGGGDRSFLLGSSAATNPSVYWNDTSPSQVVLVPTTITFTVDMQDAVDMFGFPFDPANDLVIINGDFLRPQWPNLWQDANLYWVVGGATIGNDYGLGNSLGYPNLVLDTTDNRFFTGTFTIPAGQSHQITYKYGIYHGGPSQANTNCDNEALGGQDRVRYIRANGTYNLPVDVFGLQRTNAFAAGAGEHLYGIAPGNATAGHLPLSWQGFPGVNLQTCTNLSNQVWQNVSTNGTGTTNWPTTGVPRYFRLWPTPQ